MTDCVVYLLCLRASMLLFSSGSRVCPFTGMLSSLRGYLDSDEKMSELEQSNAEDSPDDETGFNS